MLTTDHFGGPLARSNHSMRFHCFETRKHSLFLITFVLSRYIPWINAAQIQDWNIWLISSHLHSNWKDMYVLPIAPITEAHANLFAFLRARSKLCIISGAINPARVNLQIIARISPLLHRRRFAVDCHFAILSSSYRPGSAFLINQPFLIFRDCNYSYIRPPCPFVPAFLITPILCHWGKFLRPDFTRWLLRWQTFASFLPLPHLLHLRNLWVEWKSLSQPDSSQLPMLFPLSFTSNRFLQVTAKSKGTSNFPCIFGPYMNLQ